MQSLVKRAEDFRLLLQKQQHVSRYSQNQFIDSFQKHLPFLTTDDSIQLSTLRKIPLKNANDVDRVLRFMQQVYVYRCLAKNAFLFDTFSTVASPEYVSIKKGEDISLEMEITAANRSHPAEWFIVKDAGKPLVRENISDTLTPDEFGVARFKKKMNNSGSYSIVYATKIPSSIGQLVLSKTVHFEVQ